MKPVRRLLLAALLCCACAPALAHRFHIGLAEIAFNDRSGSVEVVHTYMAHDVEPLLAGLAGQTIDLGSPDAEALLRQYIDTRFYLLGAGKARLPLRWVGMAVNVDSVIVYQELPATPLVKVVHVHNEVLTDLLPRQDNTVNVRVDGEMKSLSFDAKTVERRVR